MSQLSETRRHALKNPRIRVKRMLRHVYSACAEGLLLPRVRKRTV